MMLSEARRVCILFLAICAIVRLVLRVHVHMLFSIRTVGERFCAIFEEAIERFFA